MTDMIIIIIISFERTSVGLAHAHPNVSFSLHIQCIPAECSLMKVSWTALDILFTIERMSVTLQCSSQSPGGTQHSKL